MDINTIYCPGGIESQTGSAASERYQGSVIVDCGKIPDVPLQLDSNPGPYLIPIWNSHQGEVPMAKYVWDHIAESKIRITDAWPKRIEFWYVIRTGSAATYHKIGSVKVAKTQCSGFLVKQNSVLDECQLTTIAFKQYREGAAWDGVLVAPGQGENEDGYEVAEKITANPNNFTSFMRLIAPREFPLDGLSLKSWITGVSMPSFGTSLNETVQSFFDQMLNSVLELNNIPMPIFVFDRIARVGLLFEGKPLKSGDMLDAEELEGGNVAVYEDAGGLTNHYSEELRRLFVNEFPALQNADFVLHHGVETCLFACPPLGLYTHGYKAETVEPVVRFFIGRLFKLWYEEDLKCTALQTKFFEQYIDSWLEKGSEFIQFENISPT
jgi:prephenate dehydratase